MTRLTLALIALAAAGSAQAACIYPRAPDRLPDGSTATFEEMATAQKAVRQFNEDINSYNSCLDLEMVTLEKSGVLRRKPPHGTARDAGEEEQRGGG